MHFYGGTANLPFSIGDVQFAHSSWGDMMKSKRLYPLIIVVALLSVSLSYTVWSEDTSPPLMPVRTSKMTFLHQFAYY